MSSPGDHMSPDELRRHGRSALDWIAEYHERVEKLPVLSTVAPGEIAAKLPDAAPEQGESFDQVLRDLDEIILPGITHWQSPNFFAYYPANVSGPSIIGELLSAGLGVQGMLWQTSPACTELETRVLDWLVPLLGLSDAFLSTSRGGGVIQDTASSASLCALLAARERATGGRSNASGVAGAGVALAAYCSEHANSSIEKAMMIAGLGREALRRIPVDGAQRLRSEALEEAMERDRSAGIVPFFVCATVGTTSFGAIDPVSAIAEIALRHGAWLHVDAAMAGTAALCPEHRRIHDGVERADSYCFNPHKWMFTNFDCDCFWVADRRALIGSLSIDPEYLRNEASGSGAVIDYRDWHVQLGRRFRALKLWLVLRHYGADGLRRHVRRHIELAQTFAQWVRADPEFELAVEPPLNLVAFLHLGGDDVTARIMERVNRSGRLYLTHTRLEGRLVLRLSVGQTSTELRHVEAAWEAIRQAACP